MLQLPYLVVGFVVVQNDDVVEGRLAALRPSVRVEELGQKGAELGGVHVADQQDVGPRERERGRGIKQLSKGVGA